MWAARGLLHAPDPADDESATEAIIHATLDHAWRVREALLCDPANFLTDENAGLPPSA